jgi:hypothetical protein
MSQIIDQTDFVTLLAKHKLEPIKITPFAKKRFHPTPRSLIWPGESHMAWPGTRSASLMTQSPDRGVVAEGRNTIGTHSVAVGFHDKIFPPSQAPGVASIGFAKT